MKLQEHRADIVKQEDIIKQRDAEVVQKRAAFDAQAPTKELLLVSVVSAVWQIMPTDVHQEKFREPSTAQNEHSSPTESLGPIIDKLRDQAREGSGNFGGS